MHNDLTYPNLRIKDFTLDENPLLQKVVPENGRRYCPPTEDLGILDKLPLELIELVLCQLDIRSLMESQRVNRRAMDVIKTMPRYKTIVTHARNSLRGILSIETGRWITCDALYDKLCTAKCEKCGDFGGYLYILTCKRVCFLCLSYDPELLPLSPNEAIRKFGINHSVIESLPHMRSIPGVYTSWEKKRYQRCTLIDPKSAYDAGIALHGSLSTMERHVMDGTAQKLQKYNDRVHKAVLEGSGSSKRSVRRPRTEDLFDGRTGNPLRFMAIVQAPWLNTISQEAEWGFHCIGCTAHHIMRPLHWRRKFNEASFKDHLKECGDIQDGEHQRD